MLLLISGPAKILLLSLRWAWYRSTSIFWWEELKRSSVSYHDPQRQRNLLLFALALCSFRRSIGMSNDLLQARLVALLGLGTLC